MLATEAAHHAHHFRAREMSRLVWALASQSCYSAWAPVVYISCLLLGFNFLVKIKLGFPLNPSKSELNFLQGGQQQPRSWRFGNGSWDFPFWKQWICHWPHKKEKRQKWTVCSCPNPGTSMVRCTMYCSPSKKPKQKFICLLYFTQAYVAPLLGSDNLDLDCQAQVWTCPTGDALGFG